jgi:uncharacterized membrane protein YvbJ
MDIDISNLQRKEAGSQTDDKSDEDHKTDNKAHEDHQTRLFEKYAIAVAVIVFLIIILVIIWGCYKKYYQVYRQLTGSGFIILFSEDSEQRN